MPSRPTADACVRGYRVLYRRHERRCQLVGEPNAVKIEHIDGQWAVQLVDAGEVTQHLFVTQQFARNFAAGQAVRLGVPMPEAQTT